MEALMSARRVHYFDTRLRRILCGLHGFEHRSTKHARDVTCDACIGLLREQKTRASVAPGGAP